MSDISLAQIGLGGYGVTITAAAQKAKSLNLRSLFDVDSELCQKVAKETGALAAASYEEVLSDETIDGVILILPNPLHQSMAEEAFAAGKHVYVEKPIANTMAEGRAMVAAAEKASRILMVGHNTRRQGGHRYAKKQLESGALGQIIAAEAHSSHRGGIGMYPGTWREYYQKCPAVPLMQLGVHAIDTLLYLLGPVARVSSFQRGSGAMAGDNHDVTVTLMEFESEVLCTLSAHYTIPYRNFINIMGTEANLLMSDGKVTLQASGDMTGTLVETDEVDTQMEELDNFADSIARGTTPETDGSVGLEALAVVEASILSAREGRVVDVGQV